MSNFKLELLQKSIAHSNLFNEIVKDTFLKFKKNPSSKEEGELLNLLSNQHNSNLMLLESLGLKFDNTGIIRELNNTIRELEDKLSEDPSTDIATISSYVAKLKKDIQQKINEDYGLDCSVNITISESVLLKISYLKSYSNKKLQADDYPNEFAYNLACKRQELLSEKSHDSDLIFTDSNELIFNEHNEAIIKDILNDCLLQFGEVKNITFDLSESRTSEETLIVRNLSANVITLPSFVAFIKNFKR